MKRLLGALDRTLDVFTIIMTIGIVVFVSLGVIFRFVLNYPAPWTQEMARYMFVYLTFIGSALAVREKTHITIDILVEALPRLLKTIILLLVQVGIIYFLAILSAGSWYMVQESTEVSAATLRWVKMSYIYFGVFAGTVLMIFYSLVRSVEIIIEGVKGKSNVVYDSNNPNEEGTVK